MLRFVPLTLCVLGSAALPLHAGLVLGMNPGAPVEGKLSLSTSSIHADGAPKPDIALADVLEADFTNDPFSLAYFNSQNETGDALPPAWKAEAIGGANQGGSDTFANRTLTVTGDGEGEFAKDHFFFAGMPWTGNGQWTANLIDLQPPLSPTDSSRTEVSMTLRAGLRAGEPSLAVSLTVEGSGTMRYGTTSGIGYRGFTATFPTWVRLTRWGRSMETSFSKDGKTWELGSLDATEIPAQSWLGFMVNGRFPKTTGSAKIDHILFTPTPAQPETAPPGILFKSGSYLAGESYHFSNTNGGVIYGGKEIPLKNEQVAAVLYHSMLRSQLAVAEGQQGVILKNGDFLACDVEVVTGDKGGGMVQMSSIALGLLGYYTDTIRACVFNALQEQPSDYEIRLRDGSILKTNGFSVDNGQLTIQEISGITLTVDPAQVAQFRAGTARVQSLLTLSRKIAGATATAGVKTSTPAAALAVAAATPETTPKPAARNDDSATGTPDPELASWAGPHQEQILVVPAGQAIELPLKGEFRTLAMRLAVAPGSPADARAVLHVLDGGKELGRIPEVKSGDQPCAISLPLTSSSVLTLRVESSQPHTQLLLIDPVAIYKQPLATTPTASH